jgi:hypothetical protein
MKIEFYKSVSNRNDHKEIELDLLLNQSVRSETLKTKTETFRKWVKDNPGATVPQKSEQKKKQFTGVQFSGTFTGTGTIKDINQMSGLIVLDYDHLNDLETVRGHLKNDIHTHLLFVSPSGDGLKLVVRHNLKDPDKWVYLYQEISEYFYNRTKVKSDLSGSDISRMCFIPFIDNLYRNDNSIPWNYHGTFEQTEDTEHKPQTEITEDIFKECLYLSTFISENKINICEDYYEWLSYGYSICSLGEHGRQVYHNISSVSKKYNNQETNNLYSKLLNTYDPGRTDISKYLYHSKMSIIDYILYTKYNFYPTNIKQ